MTGILNRKKTQLFNLFVLNQIKINNLNYLLHLIHQQHFLNQLHLKNHYNKHYYNYLNNYLIIINFKEVI
jgi:hypothetical protein